MQKILIALCLICFQNPVFAADDETVVVEKTPGYVSLGDAMVLNLSNDSRRLTFLQLKADVLVKDDRAREIVEKHIPAIRHQLILLLSEQSALDMKTPSKRELVRQQATQQIRDIIEQVSGNKDIEEVLFSSFLVQ